MGRAYWYWRAMNVPERDMCGPPGAELWRGRGDHPGSQHWQHGVPWVENASTTLLSSGAIDPRLCCDQHMQRGHMYCSSPKLSSEPELVFCQIWLTIYPIQSVSSTTLAAQLPNWTMRVVYLLLRSPSWNPVPATEPQAHCVGTSPGSQGIWPTSCLRKVD